MTILFLAAAVLAIAGAGTVQAADIFTCSRLGYAPYNARAELGYAARAITLRTTLGSHLHTAAPAAWGFA